MLPASYQVPAAFLLLLGGVVACFFGYRLFRLVLSLAGFGLGAFMASSVFGVTEPWTMVLGALAGGLIGAGLMIAAYFVGVALVGAGLGALVANLLFPGDGLGPGYVPLLGCSIAGAVLSMYLQRYVIIVGTAFGGAWTLIVGATALAGNQAAMAGVAATDVWVVYPLDPAPGQEWVPIAWLALGATGTIVQLGWTGGEKGRVGRRRKRS